MSDEVNWIANVMLADGTPARLRSVRDEDHGALRQLYASLSDDSRYFRFFSPASAEIATRYSSRTELDEGSAATHCSCQLVMRRSRTPSCESRRTHITASLPADRTK